MVVLLPRKLTRNPGNRRTDLHTYTPVRFAGQAIVNSSNPRARAFISLMSFGTGETSMDVPKNAPCIGEIMAAVGRVVAEAALADAA